MNQTSHKSLSSALDSIQIQCQLDCIDKESDTCSSIQPLIQVMHNCRVLSQLVISLLCQREDYVSGIICMV